MAGKKTSSSLLSLSPSQRGAVTLFRTAQLVMGGKKTGLYQEAYDITDKLAVVIQKVPQGFFQKNGFAKIEKQRNIFISTVSRNNSGKGLVGEYLAERYGFVSPSLSDRVREMCSALGYEEPHDRDRLITIGNYVRRALGDDVLIRATIDIFAHPEKENRLLFDGLRNKGEALGALNLADDRTTSICWRIITGETDKQKDLQIRFNRALQRGGPKDPLDDSPAEFKRFCDLDAKEIGIAPAEETATHTIINPDGKQEETFAQVDEIMRKLGVAPI